MQDQPPNDRFGGNATGRAQPAAASSSYCCSRCLAPPAPYERLTRVMTAPGANSLAPQLLGILCVACLAIKPEAGPVEPVEPAVPARRRRRGRRVL
jgi:hypothetical protein